jgi:hypothetical protein
MTRTPIATYNTGYSRHTTAEGVTLMEGGVLSDTQGVITTNNNKNKQYCAEVFCLGRICFVSKQILYDDLNRKST